jgi:hypothetical protein
VYWAPLLAAVATWVVAVRVLVRILRGRGFAIPGGRCGQKHSRRFRVTAGRATVLLAMVCGKGCSKRDSGTSQDLACDLEMSRFLSAKEGRVQ